MKSANHEAVADIYKSLLERDRPEAADAVATVAALLAPGFKLTPANPGGEQPTEFSAVDFSTYTAEQLAATAVEREERDYAEYCRLMGVEGYV